MIENIFSALVISIFPIGIGIMLFLVLKVFDDSSCNQDYEVHLKSYDLSEKRRLVRIARDYRIVADPIGSTSSVHRKFSGRKG